VKVRYNVEALRELAAIADYYRALNPAAGARVRAAIKTTVDIVLKSPGAAACRTPPVYGKR
jgi:plasmid stabilization system protein ParE